jgi:hypothetical protein
MSLLIQRCFSAQKRHTSLGVVRLSVFRGHLLIESEKDHSADKLPCSIANKPAMSHASAAQQIIALCVQK